MQLVVPVACSAEPRRTGVSPLPPCHARTGRAGSLPAGPRHPQATVALHHLEKQLATVPRQQLGTFVAGETTQPWQAIAAAMSFGQGGKATVLVAPRTLTWWWPRGCQSLDMPAKAPWETMLRGVPVLSVCLFGLQAPRLSIARSWHGGTFLLAKRWRTGSRGVR